MYAHDNAARWASYINTGGTDVSAVSSSALPLNTWSHVAVTYDGTMLRIYRDGVQAGTRAVTGAIIATTGALRLGGNTVWSEWFAGRIDEVRVYNRALPAAEISTDMTTPIITGPPPPDTEPPTVTLTAPAANAFVRGTVTVSATASDNVGVTSVQFLLDGQPLGAADTTDPYAVNWSTTLVADGPHTLSARAVVAKGNAGTTTARTVTVDNTAPAVSITSPADGATVSGAITVTASASDSSGITSVQFMLDGNPLGAPDTISPYTVSWPTSQTTNGSHVLTAVATDGAGLQTTSGAVKVTESNTWTPPSGLVAAYTFSEGSGASTADASGGGKVGTISGATWTPGGKFGNALSFDGVNDSVAVADAAALDLTSGMTIEAWVYPTALSGWRTVVLKEATNGLAYSLYANGNTPMRPAGYVNRGSGDVAVTGTSALPLNTWSHLAVTYGGGNFRLYVNGTQVGALALTGNIRTTTGALRIGGNSVWNEWFAGRLDEVRIYNRALTQSEIQAGMNMTVGGQ